MIVHEMGIIVHPQNQKRAKAKDQKSGIFKGFKWPVSVLALMAGGASVALSMDEENKLNDAGVGIVQALDQQKSIVSPYLDHNLGIIKLLESQDIFDVLETH